MPTASGADEIVDGRYYQVARAGSLAERLAVVARDRIYDDFVALTAPHAGSRILDVGVSDVVGEAANVLERRHPYPERITAVGLGAAVAFQAAFPSIAYRRIEAGTRLPFADAAFDIATSNAVLEHVGSVAGQRAFLAELVRVARCVFVSVPHRFFPVEHHTALPLVHWADAPFRFACRLTGKAEWARPENLILMTRGRLRALWPGPARVGRTGIDLGPFSSNLFMVIRAGTVTGVPSDGLAT